MTCYTFIGIYISFNKEEQENNSCIDISNVTVECTGYPCNDEMCTTHHYSSLVCHSDKIYWSETYNGGWSLQGTVVNEISLCVSHNIQFGTVELQTIKSSNRKDLLSSSTRLCCTTLDTYNMNQTVCVNYCKYN